VYDAAVVVIDLWKVVFLYRGGGYMSYEEEDTCHMRRRVYDTAVVVIHLCKVVFLELVRRVYVFSIAIQNLFSIEFVFYRSVECALCRTI
jgi:hypothetical protein